MGHFGATVRRLMKERGLTTRGLAQAAMVSLDTVGRVLKMEQPAVNATTYCALAAGLGLTPEELQDATASGRARAGSVARSAGDAEQALALHLRGQRPGVERAAVATGEPGGGMAALEQLRRQVHAAADLLDRAGLQRLEVVAKAELRRVLGDGAAPALADASESELPPTPARQTAAADAAAAEAVTDPQRVQDRPRAAAKRPAPPDQPVRRVARLPVDSPATGTPAAPGKHPAPGAPHSARDTPPRRK